MVEPVFTKFVSAVEGRLVPRWGTRRFFGARITSDQERAEGAAPIEWDTDRVYPLTAEFVASHARSLRLALKNGDLRERSEKEFQDWKKAEDKRRKEEAEAKKKAEEEAKQQAEAEAEAEAAEPETETAEAAAAEADSPETESAEAESPEQKTSGPSKGSKKSKGGK